MLVSFGDIDRCTDLASGVEDLGECETHARLPAVALCAHAVYHFIDGGSEDVLVELACIHAGILSSVCYRGAVLDILKSENTGDVGAKVDRWVGVAVSCINLRRRFDEVFFCSFDVCRVFHGGLNRFISGVDFCRGRYNQP